MGDHAGIKSSIELFYRINIRIRNPKEHPEVKDQWMDEVRLFHDAVKSKVATFLPQSTEYCLPRRQFANIIPLNQLHRLITRCQRAALSESCCLKVFDTLQAIKQCSRSPIILGNGDFPYGISRAPLAFTITSCAAGAVGATGIILGNGDFPYGISRAPLAFTIASCAAGAPGATGIIFGNGDFPCGISRAPLAFTIASCAAGAPGATGDRASSTLDARSAIDVFKTLLKSDSISRAPVAGISKIVPNCPKLNQFSPLRSSIATNRPKMPQNCPNRLYKAPTCLKRPPNSAIPLQRSDPTTNEPKRFRGPINHRDDILRVRNSSQSSPIGANWLKQPPNKPPSSKSTPLRPPWVSILRVDPLSVNQGLGREAIEINLDLHNVLAHEGPLAHSLVLGEHANIPSTIKQDVNIQKSASLGAITSKTKPHSSINSPRGPNIDAPNDDTPFSLPLEINEEKPHPYPSTTSFSRPLQVEVLNRHQGRFIVHATLNSIDCHALIDSGAEITSVSEAFLLKASLDISLTSTYHTTCLSVMGETMRSNLALEATPFMLGDVSFVEDFVVLPLSPSYEVIVGIDFMSKHKMVVDCDPQNATPIWVTPTLPTSRLPFALEMSNKSNFLESKPKSNVFHHPRIPSMLPRRSITSNETISQANPCPSRPSPLEDIEASVNRSLPNYIDYFSPSQRKQHACLGAFPYESQLDPSLTTSQISSSSSSQSNEHVPTHRVLPRRTSYSPRDNPTPRDPTLLRSRSTSLIIPAMTYRSSCSIDESPSLLGSTSHHKIKVSNFENSTSQAKLVSLSNSLLTKLPLDEPSTSPSLLTQEDPPLRDMGTNLANDSQDQDARRSNRDLVHYLSLLLDETPTARFHEEIPLQRHARPLTKALMNQPLQHQPGSCTSLGECCGFKNDITTYDSLPIPRVRLLAG